MHYARLTVFVIGIFATAIASLSQQQNVASIEGIVVKLGANEPIPGAVVELSRNAATPGAPPDVYTVTTRGDGTFVLRDLPAGDYRLVATRPGGTYNPAQYGQRDPRSPGTPLSLFVGQAVKDIKLEMAVTGAISGRVFDRNGEPVAYARVLAMQHWYHEGNRLLDFVQAVHTNDRGEYRLFWLPPGRYYVAARPEDMQSSGAMVFVNTPDRAATYHEEVSTSPPFTRRILDTGEVVLETYELVFYGGQTDPRKAQPIELRAGSTVPAIDIPLAVGTVRARKIQGIAIDGATGQAAAGARISALPRVFASSRIAPAATADANGVFTLQGLTSEAYILHFRTGTGNRFGFLPLDAGTMDLQGVSLVAKPGINVTGRISFDGRPPTNNDPDLQRLQVSIVQDPGIPGVPSPRPATPGGDGVFTVLDVGPVGWDFEVYVGGSLPPGTYVKSIRLGPHDVLNAKFYPEPYESQRGGLHIEGPLEFPLEIVLGTGAGAVEGRVLNEKREPAPNRRVALLPDLPLRHRFDLYRTATTDTLGRFRFQNLTPGAYKVFAWDRIETGAWEDPGVMIPFEGYGQAIQIQESGKQNIDVSVIP
jgi:hypothetical protein